MNIFRAVKKIQGKNVLTGDDMKLSKNLQILFIALAIIPFFQSTIGYKYPILGLGVQYSRYFFFGIIIILILINTHALVL